MAIEIQGIDVSKYQGSIDWNLVYQQGIQFAFVRAGICGKDGGLVVDPFFSDNLRKAEQAQIPAGVYLYSNAASKESAKYAAKSLVELLKDHIVRYPVAFDMEDHQYFSNSKDENTGIAKAFLDEIKGNQYFPMIYTFKSFAQNQLHKDLFSDYELWLAQFAPTVSYDGEYGIWQYSNQGKIAGISTRVDQNISYKDYTKIIEAAGLNHLPQKKSYRILIYSFEKKERAEEVSKAFRTLGFYNQVIPQGERWALDMYSFAQRERAEEVSKAILTLGFYNEVKENSSL